MLTICSGFQAGKGAVFWKREDCASFILIYARMQREDDSTPVKTQVKSDLSNARLPERRELAHRNTLVHAFRRIVSLRAYIGICVVCLAQIGLPCASQSLSGQEVGKTVGWDNGDIERVLWVSDEEVLLFHTGKRNSVYASVAHVFHRSERKLPGLSKQLTETRVASHLFSVNLSPDGHWLLWSLSYTDQFLMHMCDLDGKEYRCWEDQSKWAYGSRERWLSDSRQWTRGASQAKNLITHLLIQDIQKQDEEVTLPIEPTAQSNWQDEIWFPEAQKILVSKHGHSANGADSLELSQLHIGTTVTLQARHTHLLPLGDRLREVALSHDGRQIAVMTERSIPQEAGKAVSSGKGKSRPFQYALLVKGIDEPDFHVVSPSLRNFYIKDGVSSLTLSGLSWSPNGDKIGYMCKDRVFVLRVAGADTKENATHKSKEGHWHAP